MEDRVSPATDAPPGEDVQTRAGFPTVLKYVELESDILLHLYASAFCFPGIFFSQGSFFVLYDDALDRVVSGLRDNRNGGTIPSSTWILRISREVTAPRLS
jgi:hypothetical protein